MPRRLVSVAVTVAIAVIAAAAPASAARAPQAPALRHGRTGVMRAPAAAASTARAPRPGLARVAPAGLVSVAARPTTIALGGTTTLTATVRSARSGTITFVDGSRALGAVTPTAGVATIAASDLGVGRHTVHAVWRSADKTERASAATIVRVAGPHVDMRVSTVPEHPEAGDAFQATVTIGGASVDASTVSIRANGRTIATAPVVAGVATLHVSAGMTSGASVLDFTFGTLGYEIAYVQFILGLLDSSPSAITLTGPAGSFPGLPVTFAGVVSGAGLTTGYVQLRDGQQPIGQPVPVTGGIYHVTVAFDGPGSHQLTAYLTPTGGGGLISNLLVFAVTQLPTFWTVTTQLNSPAPGFRKDTFILNFPVIPGLPTPTGTFTFSGAGITTTFTFSSTTFLVPSVMGTTPTVYTMSYSGDRFYAPSSIAFSLLIAP